MKAIHILSTAPISSTYDGNDILLPFEVMSTALSTLLWRKNNGPIKFYTDRKGYDFFKSVDLLDLWDGGVDTSVVDAIDGINQNVFWAAAKLYALKEESAPVTMIDTDLFVWGDIRDTLNKSEIAVLHREDLEQTDCYLPSYELGVRDGYS